MKRVLVTGGSGFVGTNLIDLLSKQSYEICSIDVKPPQNSAFDRYHQTCDILHRDHFSSVVANFKPDYFIHLAARTDLLGLSLSDYRVNVEGVKNACDACKESTNLKRALFASSMLVCKVGHIPKDSNEFSATTQYGRSKVEGEKIVLSLRNDGIDPIIFRPTSLWGPWFGEPYSNFFFAVLKERYRLIGNNCATKTFGYVENAVRQIEYLMTNDCLSAPVDCYLGDLSPLNIDTWAKEICSQAGLAGPKKVSFFALKAAAILGDLLSHFGTSFPMTTFRLRNLTSNNIYSPQHLVGSEDIEFVPIDTGVRETLAWLQRKEAG